MTEPDVRKGMPAVKLSRDEFEKRYRSRFADPAFKPLQKELDAIVAVRPGMLTAILASRRSPARQAQVLPIRTMTSPWIGLQRATPFMKRSEGMTTRTRSRAFS